MKVKIPKKLKIGGFDFKIVIGGKHKYELRSENCWGSAKIPIQELWLDDDVLPQRLSECFLHEVFHVISDISGMDELSEKQVKGLSNGLLQIFEQLGIRFVKEK